MVCFTPGIHRQRPWAGSRATTPPSPTIPVYCVCQKKTKMIANITGLTLLSSHQKMCERRTSKKALPTGIEPVTLRLTVARSAN
jgi:hypothetical protein